MVAVIWSRASQLARVIGQGLESFNALRCAKNNIGC